MSEATEREGGHLIVLVDIGPFFVFEAMPVSKRAPGACGVIEDTRHWAPAILLPLMARAGHDT